VRTKLEQANGKCL